MNHAANRHVVVSPVPHQVQQYRKGKFYQLNRAAGAPGICKSTGREIPGGCRRRKLIDGSGISTALGKYGQQGQVTCVRSMTSLSTMYYSVKWNTVCAHGSRYFALGDVDIVYLRSISTTQCAFLTAQFIVIQWSVAFPAEVILQTTPGLRIAGTATDCPRTHRQRRLVLKQGTELED